jgi:hypothetical protein
MTHTLTFKTRTPDVDPGLFWLYKSFQPNHEPIKLPNGSYRQSYTVTRYDDLTSTDLINQVATQAKVFPL